MKKFLNRKYDICAAFAWISFALTAALAELHLYEMVLFYGLLAVISFTWINHYRKSVMQPMVYGACSFVVTMVSMTVIEQTIAAAIMAVSSQLVVFFLVKTYENIN
ncbi:hypothetical protein vBAbaMPhT2_031 [Acinetobacter phage vB_AbaM_PhT2]|uniref:Uncharacterized protein n=1 Tax=Acinetobacter phage vB_AbaM_PhT2 TaxID=2690230 RepID=A0A6B9T0E2_9CAUD|nr:hypothetical protein HYQ24_gp031 [Acinetobacter phage vB_AbaM_PhT2]QQM13787.1 hypothetical protein CPT_Maestro_053 [Acinetobacter phage Maestro]QQM18543.1 hypothetical protein CPT_Morttis_050 [Acinetobacter phage Morttis]QQO96250.1 hypothetical protein CPT_Minot_047 [Acinetobacter phage Minot]QQO96499.1 hypothetical protein CPT_Mokit_048 [Acinetobacter phage Mokit]QQO96753.1 hypothetical protein CPT_Melin_052 [Acinetobacter phage Melin]